MDTKLCPQCGKQVGKSLGVKPRTYCSKKCARRAHYVRNPERQRTRCRKWREQNPELYKQIRRESDAKNRAKINAYAREWRKKHGHNGLCPICGRDKKLVYEHCHKTGAHRGYVCRECNSGMGFFRDDPTLLRKAADYLINASPRTI